MIITIDGPSGTGKSTIAKLLAHNIGYIYFDTGAMYRCLTYSILNKKVDLNDNVALHKFLNEFQFEYKISQGERTYFVDHKDVTLKIRGHEVTSQVSRIAAIPEVRERLLTIQRELSRGVNAVFEGRDMGTVVFPDAQIKIYLTGRPEVRAERRFKELKEKFPIETADLTLEKVLADTNERDAYDSERITSPLKQAADACVIDTSDLTPQEVVLKILEYRDSLKTRRPSTHT